MPHPVLSPLFVLQTLTFLCFSRTFLSLSSVFYVLQQQLLHHDSATHTLTPLAIYYQFYTPPPFLKRKIKPPGALSVSSYYLFFALFLAQFSRSVTSTPSSPTAQLNPLQNGFLLQYVTQSSLTSKHHVACSCGCFSLISIILWQFSTLLSPLILELLFFGSF